LKLKRTYLIVWLLLVVQVVFAQISPGDLTKAHSKLEGMSNCTQCHELGAAVSDQKCLDCHNEIQSLVSQNRGLHANNSVKAQNCFECHSEHHGRNFDMVRFDQKNFNHNRTGYNLEGAHRSVDCRECHKSENISDRKFKNDPDTWLGLEQKCLSCHSDFHQGTLPNDCLQCHNMDGFTPVTKFNHESADYKLRGQHLVVDCKECHQTTVKNGKEFQQFSGLAFNDCKACHQDVHNSNLPGQCKQCHVENGFDIFIGKGNFNHTATDFDLNGSHKAIDCFTCHANTNNVTSIFQDRNNVAENNCVACHNDPHENKFGQDCAKCHNEESFLALNNMDFFDHSVTDYPLEGNHIGVDCRSCHTESFSTPINFSECKTCHADYHNGDFTENGITPDCKECHSLEKGFDFTLYTIDDHQTSNFPLEGAHVATPCFACHVSEDDPKWEFANMGTDCIDCHQNIHEGYIAEKYYPENDCAVCHSNEGWGAITFDHTKTDWPLTGAHQEVSCSACHFENSGNNGEISQNFSNLDTNCASCHENVHGNSFAINGITECSRCHVTTSWFPEKFDHDNTRFPLEGKHAQINCRACHEVNNENGESVVVYRLNKLDCKDCHL
jgi:hypothetical protein